MSSLKPKKIYTGFYTEKKSNFYGFLYPLNDKDDYKEIIENIRTEYKDARHVCFALKCNGFAKYDDDGEPKGTAGQPLYWMLNTKDIDNALLVVARHYGGKKLGAGHLYRAYLKSGAMACEEFMKDEEENLNVGVREKKSKSIK